MISTRNLTMLPSIERLKSLSQSLALLDAILQPEWEFRTYSFNAHWKPEQQMASMRNGWGDDYFLLFTGKGAILKGFAHESAMSPYRSEPPRLWPEILENVPHEFAEFLTEPAFSMEDTTFCLWRRTEDQAWQIGPIQFPSGQDDDGSAELLVMLEDQPRKYQNWAQDYFETSVDLAAIKHIFAHRPLTQAVVAALNEEVSLEDLAEDLKEIGY